MRDSEDLGDRLTRLMPRTEPMSYEQSPAPEYQGQQKAGGVFLSSVNFSELKWNEHFFKYFSHIRLTDFLLKQKTLLKTCNVSIIPPILPH